MNPDVLLVPDPSPELRELVERTKTLVLASTAEATQKSYKSDSEHFRLWCDAHCFASHPASPETVTLYLAFLSANHSLSTILRRLASIGYAHQGCPTNPASTRNALLGATMKGLRGIKGTAHHQKDPLLTQDIREIVSAGKGLLGIRNSALLLLGFVGAFRRAELVSLNCSDVSWSPSGITVLKRRSKTDGVAEGRTIGIPFGADETTCPVRALKRWLEAAGIFEGHEPIFRAVNRHGRVAGSRLNSDSVPRIIRAAARAAGMGARAVNLAGCSLRSGHVSQAAIAQIDEATTMKQTGHTSAEMLRRYRRIHDVFALNSAAQLGL